MRHYIDNKGHLIFVHAGLGGDCWMTMRNKGGGNHRVKSPALPVRDNPDQAQADLDAYALKKGLRVKRNDESAGQWS